MRFRFVAFLALASLTLTGCFDHREAPTRQITARDLNDAVAKKDTVQRVILANANLGIVPEELASMPNLDTLILRGASVTNFSAIAHLKTLRTLDLAQNKLTKTPSELTFLESLENLYLADCGLLEFPASISGISSLVYINLDRNSISVLPDTLPPNLRWLRLNNNNLSAIPTSVGSLRNLQRLYINDNTVTNIPDFLASLTLLEDITIRNNKLSSFPAVLTKLPKLRNIDISGNTSITSLPNNIADMHALRSLILSDCSLQPAERDRIRAALPHCTIIF